MAHELLSPSGGALRAGREIPGFSGTREAEAHGENGYRFGVIEAGWRESQPLSEAIPTGIRERNS